ncbi:hypothetical protein TRFO_35956 [Tritrichomonas foetus]|uniref:ARF GAP-like zinc finger-containing protein n=1 Tax=Tritrichomonas foetus TaxID=1144522 RepID=A0A1J4JJL3_9EUKA|nr:hypothetical protein TRFO_35956 [Tritrichomonas foetus]|eukprot:OHS97749.1 hypothetical protein TRFO_35956 [Tritrichomonas foetus]
MEKKAEKYKELHDYLVPNPIFIVEQERRAQDSLETSNKLRSIVKVFHRIIQTGKKLCSELNESSDLLSSLEIICTDPLYSKLIQAVKETTKAIDFHINYVSENCSTTLSHFIVRDADSLTQYHKNYEKSWANYNSVIEKYINSPPKTEKDTNLINAHQVATQSYYDFSSNIQVFEIKAKEMVSNILVSYISSFKKAFSQVVNNLEKSKQDIKDMKVRALELSAERNALEIKELKKRQKLDKILPKFWDYVTSNQPQEIRQSYQGYLWKKSQFKWHKKFFICSNGVLSYGKTLDQALKSPKNLDLLLCAVKAEPTQGRPNCFSVRNRQKQLILLSLTKYDMNAWTSTIVRNIVGKSEGSSIPSAPNSPHGKACADCGNPNSEWASINWGVTLCESCASIHRSLSSAVTMVRSLKLDNIPQIQLSLINEIGNNNANFILEENFDISKKSEIFDQSSSNQTRRTFIQQKYQNLQFVNRNENIDIFEAIKSQNVLEVYHSLILTKGNVPTLDGFNPVHAAVCIGNPLILELVILHLSSKIDDLDDFGWSPLSYASFYNEDLVVDYLLSKGADPNSSKDAHPWMIAKANHNRNIELALGGLLPQQSRSDPNKIFEKPEKPPHSDFAPSCEDMSLLLPAPPKHMGRRGSNFIDSELRTTIKKFRSKPRDYTPAGVKTLGIPSKFEPP